MSSAKILLNSLRVKIVLKFDFEEAFLGRCFRGRWVRTINNGLTKSAEKISICVQQNCQMFRELFLEMSVPNFLCNFYLGYFFI